MAFKNILSKKNKDSADSMETKIKKSANKKKTKKIIKRIVIIAVILVVILFILGKFGILDKIFGKDSSAENNQLTTYTVGTRSITQVLTSSGTIEPNDQYTINALVSGEILEEFFDEGDTVIEDQLLFRIDSENMESNITKAENNLKNARKSLENGLEKLEKLNVESDYTGTVKKIYIEEGDEVAQGEIIADIVDDSTMCLDIPFMYVDINRISVGDVATVTFSNYETATGVVEKIGTSPSVNSNGVDIRTVKISVKNTGSIKAGDKAYANIGEVYCTSDAAFYYNDEGTIKAEVAGDVSKLFFDEGDTIRKGQYIARLESEDIEDEIEKLRDNVEEAEDGVEDANDSFDNYNIEAPITGKVISKNYKVGDTIGSSSQQSSTSLAVIYDMSALKFSMSIDELDIDKLSKGQEVVVTSEAREGKEYYGTVTNISIQGTTTSGTTVYPVEVTIENVEDESLRTISEDGTINKVYYTGMTSTEKTYELVSTEAIGDGTVYTYGDGIVITLQDGTLYDNGEQLNTYLDGKYTRGSNFYKFSDNYSSLVLEVQNDKQMLRPGMNIDAEIIVEEVENVIAIPFDAVGRGNIVKVIKNPESLSQSSTDNDNKSSGEKSTEGKNNDDKMTRPEGMEMPESAERLENMEMPEGFERPEGGQMPTGMMSDNASAGSYGTAEADTEYEEVRVTTGLDDGDFVEITSGLEVGDIIIIEKQNTNSGGDYMMMSDSMISMGHPNSIPIGDMGGNGGMPAGGGAPGGMGGGFGR